MPHDVLSTSRFYAHKFKHYFMGFLSKLFTEHPLQTSLLDSEEPELVYCTDPVVFVTVFSLGMWHFQSSKDWHLLRAFSFSHFCAYNIKLLLIGDSLAIPTHLLEMLITSFTLAYWNFMSLL